MSTKKISALALIAGASISATDLVPLVDMDVITPTTYKAQAAQVRSSLLKATGAGWDPADYLQMGGGPVLGSGVIRVAQGTLLADAPFINSSATWNAGTSIMHHILVNVTDVVSHANSLLVDLQVAGISKWRVGKAGDVVQGGNLTVGGTLAVSSLSVANELDLGTTIFANVAAPDAIITGSLAGDLAVRTNARKMLFSVNNGVSSALAIAATGAITLASDTTVGGAIAKFRTGHVSAGGAYFSAADIGAGTFLFHIREATSGQVGIYLLWSDGATMTRTTVSAAAGVALVTFGDGFVPLNAGTYNWGVLKVSA